MDVKVNESPEKSLKRNMRIIYDSALRKFRSETLQEVYYPDFIPVKINLMNDVSDKLNLCINIAEDLKVVRTLSVECLQTIEDLEELCEKSGLTFNKWDDSEEVYEVDIILDHKNEEEEKIYHVKWKNYPLSQNTWEPYSHLNEGCEKIVKYYHYLHNISTRTSLNRMMVSHFIIELTTRKPHDVLCLSKLCSLILGSTPDSYISLSFSKLRENARTIMKLPFSKIEAKAEEVFTLMKFSEKRKHSLIVLQEWKEEINSNNPASYIEVENNVDLETIPEHFQFIHDYISKDIILPEEPVIFCHCNDCHSEKSSCCPKDSDAHFAYNKFGRLQLLPGYPVYECNKLCKCGPDCVNRVVQHGQKIKVCIFKTSNGCGWGLKTLETIQKDQFVLEYLGEILTSEDAEIRGSLYDNIGRSYLFDLDYGERNCLYTVDAGCAGNAAHFINHSCDPNLHVFAVWIDNQNPNLPRLAFFAKRKILRGEELTFDYKMVKHTDTGEMERIPCKCNSKNCRKFLY